MITVDTSEIRERFVKETRQKFADAGYDLTTDEVDILVTKLPCSLYETLFGRILQPMKGMEPIRACEHPKTLLSCVTCQRVAVVENCALQAENERLKVCGNCDEWHPSGRRCYMGDAGTVFTDRMDHCYFTPSCWTERITP